MEAMTAQTNNITNMGPTSGTPINVLLNQQQPQQNLYNQQQNLYNQQMMQQQALMMQQQQTSMMQPSNNNSAAINSTNIRVAEKPKKNKKIVVDDDVDSTEEEEDEIITNSSHPKMFVSIKELVLFTTLYYLMSTGVIKKTLASYIKYLNPNTDGDVSFIGIIIYGILLGSLFIITRNFLFH